MSSLSFQTTEEIFGTVITEDAVYVSHYTKVTHVSYSASHLSGETAHITEELDKPPCTRIKTV